MRLWFHRLDDHPLRIDEWRVKINNRTGVPRADSLTYCHFARPATPVPDARVSEGNDPVQIARRLLLDQESNSTAVWLYSLDPAGHLGWPRRGLAVVPPTRSAKQ
jgi:hypothetical protein